MKTLQKIFVGVFSLCLLSVLSVSCKPDEPEVANWCEGDWFANCGYWSSEKGDTILNFADRLTFSDKTFTYFKDTVGAPVGDILETDFFTPRSGITRTGTYRCEEICVYLVYSDQPQDTFKASVYNGDYSRLNLHYSPINAPAQHPAMTEFVRPSMLD